MPDRPGATAGLLGLQRAAGNRAIGRLLATGPRERRLSRDFWGTLTSPVLPDPKPTAVTPRFDVWADWDGPEPARAHLSLAPGAAFPLVVPAGAGGQVTIRATMRTGNALQPVAQDMSYTWTVKTNEYGEIEQFKKRRVRLDPPSANPAPIAVRQKEWLTATEDAEARELRLSIDYGAGTEAVQSGEQDASTGKFGGTAGVDAEGVKAGGTYEHTSSHTDSTGRQTTYAANMGNQEFAVKLVVAKAKPRPPAPKPPEPPKTRRRTWIVLFKDPSNADVPAEEEHWIHRTDAPQAETEAFYAKRVEISVDGALHSASEAEYRAVEQELIGRGEGLAIEETELEKQRGSAPSR